LELNAPPERDGLTVSFPVACSQPSFLKSTLDFVILRPFLTRRAKWRGKPMDERVEAFLADVLALEGEEASAIREAVRVALADCEQRPTCHGACRVK
jgi:hypothetical protein